MRIVPESLEKAVSRIENEEYFPLKLVFEQERRSLSYFVLCHGSYDLLELACEEATGILRRVTLVICSQYSVSDRCLPQIRCASDGRIRIDGSLKEEVPTFSVTLFSDGIEILLSSERPSFYVRTGQLVLGLDELHSLLMLQVSGMSDADLLHTKDELRLGDAIWIQHDSAVPQFPKT